MSSLKNNNQSKYIDRIISLYEMLINKISQVSACIGLDKEYGSPLNNYSLENFNFSLQENADNLVTKVNDFEDNYKSKFISELTNPEITNIAELEETEAKLLSTLKAIGVNVNDINLPNNQKNPEKEAGKEPQNAGKIQKVTDNRLRDQIKGDDIESTTFDSTWFHIGANNDQIPKSSGSGDDISYYKIKKDRNEIYSLLKEYKELYNNVYQGIDIFYSTQANILKLTAEVINNIYKNEKEYNIRIDIIQQKIHEKQSTITTDVIIINTIDNLIDSILEPELNAIRVYLKHAEIKDLSERLKIVAKEYAKDKLIDLAEKGLKKVILAFATKKGIKKLAEYAGWIAKAIFFILEMTYKEAQLYAEYKFTKDEIRYWEKRCAGGYGNSYITLEYIRDAQEISKFFEKESDGYSEAFKVLIVEMYLNGLNLQQNWVEDKKTGKRKLITKRDPIYQNYERFNNYVTLRDLDSVKGCLFEAKTLDVFTSTAMLHEDDSNEVGQYDGINNKQIYDMLDKITRIREYYNKLLSKNNITFEKAWGEKEYKKKQKEMEEIEKKEKAKPKSFEDIFPDAKEDNSILSKYKSNEADPLK